MRTVQIKSKRKIYPSDMSKNGWKTLKKVLPEAQEKPMNPAGGRPAAEGH
jgi:hypothetical protein